MGGSSVKFFPWEAWRCRAEYQAVAEACARHGFWLEPTGGIDLLTISREIVRIALDAGVEKVIPTSAAPSSTARAVRPVLRTVRTSCWPR